MASTTASQQFRPKRPQEPNTPVTSSPERQTSVGVAHPFAANAAGSSNASHQAGYMNTGTRLTGWVSQSHTGPEGHAIPLPGFRPGGLLMKGF